MENNEEEMSVSGFVGFAVILIASIILAIFLWAPISHYLDEWEKYWKNMPSTKTDLDYRLEHIEYSICVLQVENKHLIWSMEVFPGNNPSQVIRNKTLSDCNK